ncbi:MAG: DUF2971 domain-containing protein [Proteobacteria bacterium]|nr:DUF2971 domain-containing protein [Pseudomonadota bacterium]
MDFSKFVSLLEESSLFFPNVATLTDPFEGFLSRPTVQQITAVPEELDESEAAKRKRIAEHNLSFFRTGRQLLYVSCWHENTHESVAMWDLYLKSGEGVAIKTTLSRMKEAFADNPEQIHIGQVKYVDYEEDRIPFDNVLYLALHKRKSFEHEREVRALIMNPSGAAGGLVSVSLNKLIESVYVAPNAQEWTHDLIKKVVHRYGYSWQVKHSGLESNPLY